MKRTVKLRESELRQIIVESVRRVINEMNPPKCTSIFNRKKLPKRKPTPEELKKTEDLIGKPIAESFDGYDNDLDYERIYDQASHYIINNRPKIMSWKGIANGLGFRMETIGPNDMETLKDAIEDAMIDCGE